MALSVLLAMPAIITPLQPYGNVTIENGGSVVIEVGERAIIRNNFDVKLGGHLIIQ